MSKLIILVLIIAGYSCSAGRMTEKRNNIIIYPDSVKMRQVCEEIGDHDRILALDTSKDLGINKVTKPPGIPDRSPDLDVLPGFKNPPPGYGEVPFWWWTGDTLNTERLKGQIRELHKKGISGVQVNYSHLDTPGWLTDQDDPAVFSEKWWKVYSGISEECAKLNIGIGLSTYTLDWPGGARNLFYDLFYSKPELNALQLETAEKIQIYGSNFITTDIPGDVFAVRAYKMAEGKPERGGIDLAALIKGGSLSWKAPPGEWEIWKFRALRITASFNPLMAGSGDTIINGFFQQFENRAGTSAGLNFFFNDELNTGTGKYAWNPDFKEEFHRRKGYDLLEVLPAMWEDMGNITPKARMDYADVRMSLMEERYFKPIYEWHARRGMIYGCDSGGRGLDPAEFGDYFRATRWYSAPGHDTPGGQADLIKGKVSSSIANLYQRPRVWLEGYHSLGWGATPEQLMYATLENYLYGCTLLNLHGLYYTTYGSFWEWAPPCYHFRMPYWAHMDVFLKYFERLSYLMSQGHPVFDVAVVYPVAPYEAEMNGDKAREAAFDLGRALMAEGINFEFIDNESLARAVVEDSLLKVRDAGAAYRVLVFPDMDAVRWQSIEKAAAFAKSGGKVYSIGKLPIASDRAGRQDPVLVEMNNAAFKPEYRMASVAQTVKSISEAFVQDVHGISQKVRALHRKAGFRDIYMVMNARPGSLAEFRSKGKVELWDPWTGTTKPLHVMEVTATGTIVKLPLEEYEANIVVFTPGRQNENTTVSEKQSPQVIDLPRNWTVSFITTMDNSYGDFRIPITPSNRQIGLEARRFSWAKESPAISATAMLPATDDTDWDKKLCGFGTQFYILGPVTGESDYKSLESELSGIKTVDPSVPVRTGNKSYSWRQYDFSWRWGKEGDQGHQGYHGLKRNLTDDFLCLGRQDKALNEIRYLDEIEGGKYFLWSCVTVESEISADFLFSNGPPADESHTSPILTPASVFLNGIIVKDFQKSVVLKPGANTILVRYDHAGRGHFVVRRHDVTIPAYRSPLSMRWGNDDGVIPFNVDAGKKTAEWFRFTTAPGTSAIDITARGTVEAWIDGVSMNNKGNGHFIALKVPEKTAVVALRIQPESEGLTGGGLIPEPITVETNGRGVMETGDWSKIGILNNYSGGIRYTTELEVSDREIRSGMVLDLGKVAGTAEVAVNGKKAGVKVAPPWKIEISGYIKHGKNTIEVIVYNTLANHYQTIPSNYRGNPVSGLIGPVKLEVMSLN